MGYRGFDPFEDTARETGGLCYSNNHQVTGGSIRLRILQDHCISNDGASLAAVTGGSIRLRILQDKKPLPVGVGMEPVTGGSIRLRILQVGSDSCPS